MLSAKDSLLLYFVQSPNDFCKKKTFVGMVKCISNKAENKIASKQEPSKIYRNVIISHRYDNHVQIDQGWTIWTNFILVDAIKMRYIWF